MPGVEWPVDWQSMLPEAANLFWLLCIIIGGLAGCGVALFGVETRHLLHAPGELRPQSEIMGFGKPVTPARPGIILKSHETPNAVVHASADGARGGSAVG